MKKIAALLALMLALSAAVVFLTFDMSKLIGSRQQANDAMIERSFAEHVGVLAYLYAYPIVDMVQQMHNETHIVGEEQLVFAPVNRFYRFPHLVTPETQGNFRAPNNDTLYFTAWFDISEQPIVIHTPDTTGRYFTIAVTNQYAEVEHIGRRTTGTEQRFTALVPPGFDGALPPGVHALEVETPKGWLLGRMLVDGPEDFETAFSLVEDVWISELSDFHPQRQPETPVASTAEPMSILESPAFFEVFNRELQSLPIRPGEAALLEQFKRFGIGHGLTFDWEALPESIQEGLTSALAAGKKLVEASTARTVPSYNGWMVLDNIGRYGYSYLDRASVVAGGYGNLPEESLYPAKVFDEEGRLLNGKHRYRLHFPHGQLPPVAGFWSLSVYRLKDFSLVSNAIERYSIGDRTPGLQYNEDGSLTLWLSHEAPTDAEQLSNWMPTPEGAFSVVMRLYEPRPEVLDYSYQLPALERVD